MAARINHEPGHFSSPAFAKGLWGQSRSFYSGAVLGYVKDKHDRPDAGSDVGGLQETGLSKQTVGHASHVICLGCVADVVSIALQVW